MDFVLIIVLTATHFTCLSFKNYFQHRNSRMKMKITNRTCIAQWKVIIFHRRFGAATYLSLSPVDRDESLLMFLSEKTNKRTSGSDKDQLRPANASAMLCKCNKFFEAENKHFSLRTENNDTCRLQLTNFLLGFISTPHTAIFHHSSLCYCCLLYLLRRQK